jgi:asparagine synthase (glutamine-hydrolysing)
MKVELSFHNCYYPWTEVSADGAKCWLKGTFFHENELLQNDDTVRLFSSAIVDSQIDHEALKSFLLGLNGNFALAMETSRYIFCVVDRVRSIPLFYAVNDEGTFFSDDANYLRDRLNPPFNEENGAEFLVTGYVTGPDTLFDGISQIQAGEYLIYDKVDGSLVTQFYHRFWHENFFSDSEEELLDRLDEIFVHVFQRLIASTKGRQIVVPLSGGLDSRIIVAMLKRLGVEDVVCFTYGKRGNREAEISRQVAEALGYQWYFVEYTNEKWYDYAHTDDMREYYSFAGNLVSLPHIQDLLAVKELKEKGKIREGAVFVPGHSGDMLAGSWIPKDYDQLRPYAFEDFLGESLRKHYALWKWNEPELALFFKTRIQKCVGDISIHDNESCANAVELFNFNERQAKFIVNSVRVYEFLGFEWRIPLWDAELIDFFLKIPISYRISQLLYISYAKRFFTQQLQSLSEIECTTNISSNLEQTKSLIASSACRVMNIWEHTFTHVDWGWSSNFKRPLIATIFTRFLGYPNTNFKEYSYLKGIIRGSRWCRVPSCNGTQTIVYLQDVIEKPRTTENL